MRQTYTLQHSENFKMNGNDNTILIEKNMICFSLNIRRLLHSQNGYLGNLFENRDLIPKLLRQVFHSQIKIKADRPHPRDYPHTPYWLQTNRQNPRTGNDHGSSRRARTSRHTNGRTDGRYQLHYLPRFAVDNNIIQLLLTFHFMFFSNWNTLFSEMTDYFSVIFWVRLGNLDFTRVRSRLGMAFSKLASKVEILWPKNTEK